MCLKEQKPWLKVDFCTVKVKEKTEIANPKLKNE